MPSICLVGSWAKVANGDDALEMAENVFLNRDNIKPLPEDREYLKDFREKHPDVKAALVEGIDLFDDQYFGTGESEAICMDPQQRMLMQGVVQALENAGITIEMASEAKIAVYTAAWAYDYKDLLPPDQYMATGNSASVMCGRITYFLNSRGAAVGIETACSSSLVAFHLARQSILSGESKLALVCGANHVGARSFHSLYNSHMVSPNGRLAAFDKTANGFVRAESFAVAVLCSKQFAEENNLNVHCECIGSAYNSDGKTPSLTAPNPVSQYEVQLEAMKHLDPNTVQLVTCHGTGTKLGDQVELTAIKKSFKSDIKVMSPKSSLGHGEGAAGLVGVLQSLYSMQHNIIPNQLHLQIPSDDLGVEKSMSFVNEEQDLQCVAISSYGFGGTNACAILEKPKAKNHEIKRYAESKVLFLSAKCPESLKQKIENYALFMEHTDATLEDILYTENVRKTKYDVRAAVFGKNQAEIAQKLRNNDYATSGSLGDFEIEFGEGNEKLWLLRMLYESNRTYQKAVDKYCQIAETYGIPEARTALFFPFKLTLTPLTYNVSRLITSMATFALLLEYEALPNAIRGKGMGQIFCLAAANVISFEKAIQLIKAVIADVNLIDSLADIELKTAKVAIDISTRKGKKISKKVTPLDIVNEINSEPLKNLMRFKVDGSEIIEADPVKKVQKLVCQLFVSGYDPVLNFQGSIVKTPGYSFLKRKFWPESINSKQTEIEVKEEIEPLVSDSEMYDTVKGIVKKFLDIDEDDVNLLDSGIVDSLTSIEMIEAIGAAFNKTMPFDLLETNQTISAITDFLKTFIVTDRSSKSSKQKTRSSSKSSTSENINVIASDFMFAGVEGEKELWNTLLTSKIVTGKINDVRRKQCEGDAGLEVGLLKQDISTFDNSFFSIAKDEAEFVDPQHRLLLHSAYNALEKCGLESIPDADLFLAISSHSEYRAMAEKHIEELDERLWMGTVHSMAAGRLAALLGIRGKAHLVDTTCSSIATALEMAVDSIRQGKKYAVVATSQLIQSSKWLYSLRTLLDHHNTKSFSSDGTGFCRSDGVGVIILKAYEPGDAGIIRISAAKTHHSGRVITPVVSALSQLLEDIGSVSYIEGHGTATIAGDGAESMAYQKMDQEIVMSSVKAQFGHCEVASGLIQLMKVASLTKNGIVPAIVHNFLPNEFLRHNDNLRLPFVSEEYEMDRSAIVSFGITGTNTVVTTEKPELNDDELPCRTCYLFPISAKTKDAMRKAISSFIEMIQNTGENLHDISTSMQKQKTHFKWRAMVVASNHFEVVEKFKEYLTAKEKTSPSNWHISTTPFSVGCSSFIENVPDFENHYSTFCQRLRFEPFSDPEAIYHSMAVTYALVKTTLHYNICQAFTVSGFNSLVILAAINAAPSHYLNDLMHSFVNNDIRMMKRIARDVTIQIDGVNLFDFSGAKIETARQAVESCIQTEVKTHRFPEGSLLLSTKDIIPNTEALHTCSDYYHFIGEKFLEGGKLNFENIFGTTRKIIELPEYPFNRKSFWLPIKESVSVPNTVTFKLENQVNNEYEFVLNSEKWKHVRDHVVDSKIVLPGATSMRLVYELHASEAVTLSNIDFLNKIMPIDSPTSVKQRRSDDQFILTIGELDAISFNFDENSELTPLPFETVQAATRTIDDIYHRFSLSQLTYRNKFQMIDSLRFNLGRGEARFNVIDNLDILIDGTLQTIVVCYFFENSEDYSTFVPFTIDKISMFTDNIALKNLRVMVQYESSGNFITGNATVYDDFENVILHITNVSFKRLNGTTTPSVVSRSVLSSKNKKGAINEQAKREARNMLHLWFEDNFGWSDIDDTTGFFDLGLTSIQAVKLRNVIKSNYPDASTTSVFDYPTIQELSTYLSTLITPIENESNTENDEDQHEEEEESDPPTRLSLNPIGVMAASCRLPGGVTHPAELWELLKIGRNASSRTPATRIPTRNTLIAGTKYGNPVEGGNFISDDISQFDPAFFKISKSEAEMIDPQQRILLECVQECLENSGVTETNDVGVFIGLMEKEYQDMMESSSILAMLGSMAAVIAGRINYVFGCHGPSVTIDTACSSSLVAVEMAVNALLDNRCSKVIVAGVNLILNEKGQGMRTNGKMLSQHGMSLSFDSRASGYGRSDGCVVLMLELAKPNFHYMSTIQAVNVNHGGRSVSLTAPNGVAHKMLLTSVINQSPSLAIDYWEAHGTGTPLGDPIEFNTLSSIFQNIVIGSVKASLGHGEASAGTCGLLKLFLMLTNHYVPSLIHFHCLNKDINAGSIRLPIIGEEADLSTAGISSFGVSGTNAAAIAFNDNNKLEPYTSIHKKYIFPISAKNQVSLEQLEKQILSIIPVTDTPISSIASALANNRVHFTIRNAIVVSHSGIVLSKSAGKPHRMAKKEKYRIKLGSIVEEISLLQFDLINEMYTVASLKNPPTFALKYALVKFLTSLSPYIEIIASDVEVLLALLLADGSLKWNKFDTSILEMPIESVLNNLAENNLNANNNQNVKNHLNPPDAKILRNQNELYETIVEMYINGYDLEWNTVYTPVSKFINIPNYAFNKQSLWFEERTEIIDHYLIGTCDEENDEQLVLKNQISELRHPQFFKGKPLDVGTMFEMTIEALKIRHDIPFSIQNLNTKQITLTKPVWLKTIVQIDKENDGDIIVKAFIDDQLLFGIIANSLEREEVELPFVDVQIPEKVVYLSECPNAIIRRHRNLIYVDSTAEPSPFRTANIVLNEIIGFTPNPSDMFLEIFGGFPSVYYMVQVDDGALWQFQIISQDKHVLSNVYVLKDAKGLEIPTIRMHKKSTLLSSQEAQTVALKTLQLDIWDKVKRAFNDVIDSGLEIDESQMSTGFTELGMDSLATVDLLNRLNQKYFPEIELTTSDLFDNPNIVDLSVRIEEMLKEKGIDNLPSTPVTPKTSIRERKLSIPANRHQELAQIEFVKNYEETSKPDKSPDKVEVSMNEGNTFENVDRYEIRRKISTAVLDIATESLNTDDIDTKGFTELGMDSLSIVDFVNRLNEKYFPGEDINASDVFDYPTVDELTDHITRKKSIGCEMAPIVENGVLIAPEKRNEEFKKSVLTQSYLLIDDNELSFVPDLVLSFNLGKLQISDDKGNEVNFFNNAVNVIELKKITKTVNNKILLKLDEYSNDDIKILYLTLLNLMKTICENKIKCQISVSSKFSVGNSTARAFMKTIASEKYPLIEYIWDQKIQQIAFDEIDAPVSGNWLITGGMSGIGFEIGKYLGNNGAENVVLISRRKPSDDVVKEVRCWNATVHTIAADISDEATMIKELAKINIKITGIIHSAGVLKDSKIERQTEQSFAQVFQPKANGFIVLEKIENHFGYEIDNFIVMSSFTAGCGNEGQLNYGVSNAYLEHQIRRRRLAGKSGTAIQWGNWIDTGMATNAHVRKFLADLGFLGQHNEEALKYLRCCIEYKPEVLMVANIDWNVILKNRKDLPRDLVIDGVKIYDETLTSEENVENGFENDFEKDFVKIQHHIEDRDDVLDVIKLKICEMVKMQANRLKNNRNIMEIGLDSRLLAEFISFVNFSFKTNLNLSDAYTHSTLEQLTTFIWENLQNNVQQREKAADNQDFCPLVGINVFFDEIDDLEVAKSNALEFLKSGKILKANGKYCLPVVGKSMEDVFSKIKTGTKAQVKEAKSKSKTVMMLTGQGSQYPMMGRQLCEHFEIFRSTLETCLKKCDEYLKGDVPLWEILFNTDHYQHLQLTKHMQPIMFSFGYACAKLWENLGVVPDFYLGHSVGELAAGVLAGIMTIDDGLKLIVERGKAMENIAGLGALLAVQREIADDVLRKYQVCVATINSPKQVVFAGTKDELDKALAFVKGQGKQGTFVNQKYPFHSNIIQESHLMDLRRCLENIEFSIASTPLISNITGQVINTFSEEYIIKHTVSAVKFVNCVENLQNLRVTTWIDAGPAAVLATFVKRIIVPTQLPNHKIVQTCKEKDSDVESLVHACLELEQAGMNIKWNRLYGCDDIEEQQVLDFPITMKSTITDEEMKVLEDHRLNGRIIIAGAYQMYQINKLVKENAAGLDLILKNVKFLRPWYVEDGLEFSIRWNADMSIEVVVNDSPTCCAKIEIKQSSLPQEVIGPSEIEFNVDEFYDHLFRNQLQYHDGFRKIEEAKRSEKRCFAKLKSSLFTWPLIDAAMHSITACVVKRRPDSYFLPVAMGSVNIINQNVHQMSNLTSQAVITSENDKFIQVNLSMSAGKNVALEIKNMTIVVMKINAEPLQPEEANNSNSEKSEIQIVGFDVTFPFNNSSENQSAWQFLKNDLITDASNNQKASSYMNLLGVDKRCWDPEFFGIRPTEAAFIDPQQRLLLTSVAKLLDSVNIASLPTDTGVFVGCSTYEFSHIVYAHGNKAPKAEWGGGTAGSALAGRIAHWLKLTGPVITLDTACSSSFYALTLACDALNSGKCRYAIVGTVNLAMHKMTSDVLRKNNMIVEDFCKVFDCNANGYKRSEAICTLLLTKNAIVNSVGSIIGWASGHNGNSSSLFTPNGKSQINVMRKCLNGSVDINHVEAHCTGTKIGDPIELKAISNVIKSDISVSSLKSRIGHCEGASGLMALCSTLLQYSENYQLGQHHLKRPNLNSISNIKFRFVGEEAQQDESKVLMNNFGFTGSNCSVLLKAKLKQNSCVEQDCELFYTIILSSHTLETLKQRVETFLEFVHNSSNTLHNICETLKRKKVYRHRTALIFDFRRRIVWRSDNKYRVEDERISEMVIDCELFIKNGNMIKTRGANFVAVPIPPLVFKKDCYWNLEPFYDEIDANKRHVLKDIYFEKLLVPTKIENKNHHNLKIASVGKLGSYRSVTMEQLNVESFDILVYQPVDSTVKEFMELINIWKVLDAQRLKMFVLCRFSNGTTHTEWTGALRSLAAEKMINYKFVSVKCLEQLDENLNECFMFEAIHYQNGIPFVERICKVDNPVVDEIVKYNKILMSGGTGGIGSKLLEKFKPNDAVIISRNVKHSSLSSNCRYFQSDVANFKCDENFDAIFHLAGNVENATHYNMTKKSVEKQWNTKFKGAENLAGLADNFVFSSSIATIIGSYGQSNYAFVNGVVTSYLEKFDENMKVIHWGPWKDVGMLAKQSAINKQLKINGWFGLTTEDALSVFDLKPKKQIIVFDGDFETIVTRQPHLRPFLSNLVKPEAEKLKIPANSTFDTIFVKITGISDIISNMDTPFMDLGMDSLSLENLRQTINVEMGLELTVSDVFENPCIRKLKELVGVKTNFAITAHSQPEKPTKNDKDDKIAVIGWSAEFSDSPDIESFWKNLLDGTACTTKSGGKLKTPNCFDNKFFNITDEDAKVLDPQVKKFVQHAYLALENSGYINQRKELKCAVFAGAEPSTYGSNVKFDDAMKQMFSMNMQNFLPTYASYCLDLNGEAVSVYSACSTTLVAIVQAVQCLQQGRADIALVGAASVCDDLDGITDSKNTIFSKSGVCRPFDKNSEGIVRGSGVGCLVLKKLQKAVDDCDVIHCVIKNFGLSNDGNSKASFMAPNPAGQLKCMQAALNEMTDEDRARIEFIECHATGTTLGDAIELDAVKSAYSNKKFIKLGSAKANIGHSYASSGLASIIKCAKILKTGLIPAQINFEKLRTGDENFFKIPRETNFLSKDALVGINSFGIGGTNVHMIIEGYARRCDRELKTVPKKCLFLPISGKSEEILNSQKAVIKTYLMGRSNKSKSIWENAAKTLINNRQRFEYCSYLLMVNNEIKNDGKNFKIKATPKICFFFAPQGVQYSNILQKDMECDSDFNEEMTRLTKIASKYCSTNFDEVINSENNNKSEIDDPLYSQVAILIQCMVITNVLKKYGIKPQLLVGHSVGEYIAAVVGEVLEEEKMIELLFERSRLVSTTKCAKMLMIWDYFGKLPNGIEMSSNVDNNIECVVGEPVRIFKFIEELKQKGIKYREINTSHGFHSSMMQPIAEKLKRICKEFNFEKSTIPLISSITGGQMRHFTPDYAMFHLTNAVNLQSLVDTLVSSDIDIIVEIGPSGILSNLLAQRNSKIVVIPTCGSKKKPIDTLQQCLGLLWSNGVDVNVPFGSNIGIDPTLPGYPFENRELCLEKIVNLENEEDFKVYAECLIEADLNIIASETSDVLLYEIPDEIHAENLYFNVESLIKNLEETTKCVVVIAKQQSNFLIHGLLRCFQLQTNKRLVYVENFDNEPISQILKYVLSSDQNFLKISGSSCFYKQYKLLQSSVERHNFHGKVIIFGGNGSVGSAVVDVFTNVFNLDVVSVNGRTTCDILEENNVVEFLKSLNLKNVKFIVNCVGKETISKLEKSKAEILETLELKTTGNLNILKAVEKLEISVEKYITCSSMSSVIPLFGNEDYASANCFVESLVKQKWKFVSNILVWALPPIEGSRMVENSSGSAKGFMSGMMMNRRQLMEIIKKTINMKGTVFISSEDPAKLDKMSVDFHKGLCLQIDEQQEEVNEINEKEKVIAIWKEVIGQGIEIKDETNFFSIGGDSLNALQVVWLIQKRLNRKIHVNDVFKFQTFVEFFTFVTKTSNLTYTHTILITDYDNIPLTDPQTQMFVLRHVDQSSKYNVVFEIRVNADHSFNYKALKHSILSLLAYQTGYRTTFMKKMKAVQKVVSLTESYYNLDTFQRLDISLTLEQEIKHQFNIENQIPLRILIVGDQKSFHIVFNQHHILTDGWSMTILAKTINMFYDCYLLGTNLPEKLRQSLAHVAMKEPNANNIDKVLKSLEDGVHTVLPYDHSKPEAHKRMIMNIPNRLWHKLLTVSNRLKTTPYTTSLSLFIKTLFLSTGMSDLLFAFADSGRNQENSELIGYCMNNILFKCVFNINDTLSTLNSMVAKKLEESRKFSDVPFYKLVEKQKDLGAIAVYFNFRQRLDFPSVLIQGADCEIRHVSLNNAFDFSFTIDETEKCAQISVDYNSGKYLEKTIVKFVEIFFKILNDVDRNRILQSTIRKCDFPLKLPFDLNHWKDNEAVAVLDINVVLSYDKLGRSIHKTSTLILKESLIKLGTILKEDDLIGFQTDNKLMTVLILSTSQMGVSYAPIDSDWPLERQKFVQKRCNLFLKLSNKRNKKMRVFNRRSVYGSMYTIFTSGSTGVPKGVVMGEQSVAAFITSATKTCGFREQLKISDSVKHVFDVSVSNIFGSALNFGTLVAKESDVQFDVKNCQYAFLPAAVFNSFSNFEGMKHLERITVGGETISDDSLQNVLQQSCKVVQIYGPTETCIWSMINKCNVNQTNGGSLLGSSIENEICDTVPISTNGQLLVQGVSLARGYLTNDQFAKPFKRVYNTGDFVKKAETVCYFLGRRDNQVKWKGIRIDLSATEKEIKKLLCLQQVKLLLSSQQLIAFLTFQPEDIRFSEIVSKLKGKTTVPDHFVAVQKMPLNSSGKIDKTKLLQAFEQIRKSYQKEKTPIYNSVEEKIVRTVTETIGQPVKLNDIFSNIGGNSLSAIEVTHKLAENLGIEIKAHELLQSQNLKQFSELLVKQLRKPQKTKEYSVITKLREAQDSKFSIYLIHAIGGTIYPYYSFLQIFPKNVSIYGIEFDLKYPCSNLRELSQFYAREISAHAGNKQIFVMGHSMGGIMSREIVEELKIWGYKIPFILMFDSWVLRTNELDIDNIRQFITYVFSSLPDSEHRIDRAIKLAELLREYKTSISETKLYLFKSKQLGDAAFKKAVRTDLNEELARAMICNGFDELSTQPIETNLIDGDHESCLKVENLRKVKDLILLPFKPYF